MPRRMLALAGDRRLVEQVRRGNEAAFELVFQRYHLPLLTFCRHMLGSREDAEDALQQTFASAYRAMCESAGPLALKAWLFTIARNRCISMLRAPRAEPVEDLELEATAGLSEQVERRAELRDLVLDLGRLPENQRAALVLFEVGGLSQAEIGDVLDVHAERVKALVFQARTALMDWRSARATPCADVREALAAAGSGRPRKAALRRHLATCDGCSAFAGRVKEQRALLAIALPAIPSVGLWESVAAAAGVGGGSAGGGLLAGGLSGLAGSGAAKVIATGAVVGALAGGGALVAGDQEVPHAGASDDPAGQVLGMTASGGVAPAAGGVDGASRAGSKRSGQGGRGDGGRGDGGRGGSGGQSPGAGAQGPGVGVVGGVQRVLLGVAFPSLPAAGEGGGSGGGQSGGGAQGGVGQGGGPVAQVVAVRVPAVAARVAKAAPARAEARRPRRPGRLWRGRRSGWLRRGRSGGGGGTPSHRRPRLLPRASRRAARRAAASRRSTSPSRESRRSTSPSRSTPSMAKATAAGARKRTTTVASTTTRMRTTVATAAARADGGHHGERRRLRGPRRPSRRR